MNLLGPSRCRRPLAATSARPRTSSPSRPRYVAGTAAGRRAREAAERHAVLHRGRLAGRGGGRPSRAGRRRRREPRSRARLERFQQGGPRRAGRRRLAAAGRQDREAAHRVGRRPDGRAGPGPCRAPWAGPTPTPTPRRWANGRWSRSRGDVPVTIVRPSIIESALAEPRAGLDPRLPHGRARDHLLRPRPADASSPACPRASSTSSRSTWSSPPSSRWRPRGPLESGPDVFQVASGSRNPLHYRRLVDLVRTWFSEHPLYDTHGQPIVVPEWSFPGRGRVQRQLAARHQAARLGREGGAQRCPCAASRPTCRAGSRSGGARPTGRSATSSCTAPTPRREAVFRVDRLLELFDSLDDGRQDHVRLRPRSPSTGTSTSTTVHLPSIVAHARVRTSSVKSKTPTREERGRRGGPLARPPHGGVRPGEHAHRVERGRVVRLAGHPAPAHRRAGPVRAAHAARGARACWPWTAATAATSSATSTGATRTPRGAGWPTTRGSCSATSCSRSRSRPASAGCGSTARSATAPCSSPAPSTS